ncbi:PREDICTED: transmembrane protein 231-like [Amphimedon queenslandica]|uniref:Transmembrane protein 231 n=1 Tax=Amphimedon queenslandica TaxID=400682 RepID=A0A1X7VFG5_AMPQE|nr:PREDICTED: transmembrane protein 231-like [Amphimedon queenslandica]|eukprot:XP_003384386.1 PREDICTED: transmembrane protein 231-like [Amphimedon queenslandica]
MVLYRVFSTPHLIKHYSTVFSKATVFQIITYALVILAPFFIAYSTRDFWQYTSSYREQADIHFIGQWIFQVTTDASPIAKTWSSYNGLNRLLQDDTLSPLNSEISIPIVKFREQDYNYDRINDQLLLTIEYNELEYNITGIQGLLFFEVSLNSHASVTLQGLIHFSNSWSLPASHYWLLGDTLIYQRDPLPATGRLTTHNTTIYNDTSRLTQDNEIIGILKNYQQRNLSISLANRMDYWEYGTGSNFTAHISLTFPVQTLIYIPGLWQVLKFAWIQYLAILVIFYAVLSCVQSFVFQNQIILTVQARTDKKPHQR